MIDNDLGLFDRQKIAIIDGKQVPYDYVSWNPDWDKTPEVSRILAWCDIELERVCEGCAGRPYLIHGDYQPPARWRAPRYFWQIKAQPLSSFDSLDTRRKNGSTR